MTEPKPIGRNEPCPCGSRKKYKRCHGVDAAPKLTEPKAKSTLANLDPASLGGMDPEVILQFSQALQKLPKGQIQRFQSIMQKAMNGRDVTAEASEFEKTLPLEFQTLLQSFTMPGMPGAPDTMMGEDTSLPLIEVASSPVEGSESLSMTEDEARALVLKAAEEGKISQEQAGVLLTPEPLRQTTETSKLGRLWRNIAGKKT